MKKSFLYITLVGLLLALSPVVSAMPILTGSVDLSYTGPGQLWTASDGKGRSASAEFSIDDSTLTIVLTNLAASTHVPNEVLAGLFFGVTGGIVLSKPHVMLADGSEVGGTKPDDWPYSVWPLTAPPNVDLDGEYGFRSGINDINGYRGEYGISSTAFDPGPGAPPGWDGFGVGSIINPSLHYGNPSPNGPDFGLVNGDPSSLVASIDPYVMNSVVITFGFPETFDAISVDKVSFLYGTDYTAPVPEPATMFLLGSGLICLGVVSRRYWKS